MEERDGNIRARGKTARDRANNKPARNASNKQLRADWERSKRSQSVQFPISTCNGKKTQRLYRKSRRKGN